MAVNERAERVDPFGIAALAAAGTFAAHEVGYLVDSGDSPSHAYFAVLGPLVVIAASIAGWLAAVRLLRADGRQMVSWRALCAVQIAGYLALEVGERVPSGQMASLFSAPVVLGLVLQPLFAWAALRLVRTGARVIERFAKGVEAPPRASTLSAPGRPAPTLVPALVGRRLHLRGPPV